MAECHTCGAVHVKWEEAVWYNGILLFLCQKHKHETLQDMISSHIRTHGTKPLIENWAPYNPKTGRSVGDKIDI